MLLMNNSNALENPANVLLEEMQVNKFFINFHVINNI